MKRIFGCVGVLLALFFSGCGGGGSKSFSSQNQNTSPSIVSISVSPATLAITVGETKALTATARYSDNTTKDVTSTATWTTTDAAKATVTAGSVKAVAVGTATITATVSNVSGTVAVTVAAPPAPTLSSIALTPASSTLAAGTSRQLTATGTYSDNSTKDISSSVQWSSSAPTVAGISNTGLVNALSAGTTSIQATSGNVIASATVTVTASTPAAKLEALSIAPKLATISLGETQQFSATGKYSDGSSKDLTSSVSWTTADGNIATITAAGLLTGIHAGITGVSAAVDGLSASTMLTVNAAPVTVTSVTIVPDSSSIAAGTGAQLTAQATYSDGSSRDVTESAAWRSAASNIAVVDALGFVKGISAGSTQITATVAGVPGTATITVTSPTLTGLSVGPDGLTFAIGIQQQLTATGTFSDGSTDDLVSGVQWSSSDASIATIDAKGVLTTLAEGNVTITATVGSQSDTVSFTVVAAHLTGIVVTPANATLHVSSSQQFVATGVYDDGSTQPLTAAQWTSSSSNVASVDSTGVVTALTAGQANITATLGAISGSATVTVAPAQLVSIAVTPADATMAIGAQRHFTATGAYSDGSTSDVTSSALWSSSNALIATVDNAGLATSFAAGSTTITASFGLVSGSTNLTVSAARLVSIAITPDNPVVGSRTMVQFTATGTFSDGSTSTALAGLSWKSSKPRLANMRKTGIAFAKRSGSVTITALVGTITDSTTLTISNGTLQSIEITPASVQAAVGEKKQFMATGHFSDGTAQDMTSIVHWSSSNASVAVVENTPGVAGLATAIATGTTNVGVQSGSVTNAAVMNVQ